MARYLIQRVLWAVLLLWLVTLITFTLTHVIPGDPATFMAGFGASKESIEAMRVDMGLDKPLPVQYWLYVSGLVHLDFGTSLRTHQAVSNDLKTFLPASLELAGISFILYILLAVGLGSVAASRRGRLLDGAIRMTSMIGSGIPVFWVALLLQEIFFAKLEWFPFGGRLDIGATNPPHVTGFYAIDALLSGEWGTELSVLWHLILPVVTIVLAMLAVGLRSTRASVLAELDSGYVRTARAKGVSEWRLYIVHLLRNALNPVISVMSLQAGHLLGWIVLVETIFDWPGLGFYAYQSIQNLDYAPIMALTLILSFAFILVNLIADLSYPVLDPRIRAQ